MTNIITDLFTLKTPVKKHWSQRYVLELFCPDGRIINKYSYSFEKLHNLGCSLARDNNADKANIFYIDNHLHSKIIWMLNPAEYFDRVSEKDGDSNAN